MTITPKTALKCFFAATAVFALSACNTMKGDRGMDSMNHDRMDHMSGAMLTGAAEVPGPGDSSGKGHFHYTLDINSGQLCYKLQVEGIGAPTAAHIHEGAVGVAGAVVVMLQTPMLDLETDTCMAIDAALARRLMATPSSFYVNVHDAAYPKGAMRGQLMAMMHTM